jgi:hypothetical protein
VRCLLLTRSRLGPHKLAYVLNKCLDRFEDPDENVQRDSSPNDTCTIDPPQLPSQITTFPPPSVISPMPTFSPGPVEMPPLLNQPHWQQTDKPQAASSPSLEFTDMPLPALHLPSVEERTLPARSKLTGMGTSLRTKSSILITDDNAINRRVSLPMY